MIAFYWFITFFYQGTCGVSGLLLRLRHRGRRGMDGALGLRECRGSRFDGIYDYFDCGFYYGLIGLYYWGRWRPSLRYTEDWQVRDYEGYVRREQWRTSGLRRMWLRVR